MNPFQIYVICVLSCCSLYVYAVYNHMEDMPDIIVLSLDENLFVKLG